MRRKKIIILHNPQLIKVRKNLRALIEQAYLSRLSSMLIQSQNYRKERDEGKVDPIEEEKLLSKAKSELMNTYCQSILFCNLGAACFTERGKTKEQIYDIKLERDMVWAPWMGGWICLQCYNSFCIQQYDFDVKKRDFDKEKRFLELLKKHKSL